MKNYLKLMRVHHYLKNGLIFLPLIFGGQLFQVDLLMKTVFGFLAFSLSASIVYIINDIRDVESDRKHIVKCKRPIASGVVSTKSALILVFFLLILTIIFNYFACGTNILALIFIIIYILLNFLYSMGLKNIPLVDIAILVSGFLFRVLYGSEIVSIEISKWLYLTVISMSFYLGLGKRRNEIIKQGSNSRKVLKYYNHNFLDKNMYMFLSLTIGFYALWCVDPYTIAIHSNKNIIWTVPLVMLICMKYSLNVESDSYGDPVEVLLEDKVLLLFVVFYGFITFSIIYMKPVLAVFNINFG